jgi:quercetin dioxygenase-like cupin family protein
MSAVHGSWNWSSIPVETIAPGIERQMIHGERLMLCRLRFAPGTVAQPHAHRDVLLCPAGFWHGATILDEETVLIDIFSPIREDFLQAPAAEPAR